MAGLTGCDVDLGERAAPSASSFGAIVFREACQRVTYSAELSSGASVDASGARSRAVCLGTTAPADAAPTVQALFSQRENVVLGVDRGVPESLYAGLDGYLRALEPLQDDGTLGRLIDLSANTLDGMATDPGIAPGLARLGRLGGMRPASTAGGVGRALVGAPALDAFIGASLPLLDRGGAAEAELQALLTASAFELRHLTRSTEEPGSPERSAALLHGLLTTVRPELVTGQHVLVARRDPRGLPLLAEIVAPYVRGEGALARADAEGHFLDGAGQRIAYVAPLPEPGKSGSEPRDALGRALRSDGKPLYAYTDLDGTLVTALLADAQRLVDDTPVKAGAAPRDMLLGLLRGASLLAGTRVMQTETRDGESLQFRGFDRESSTLLDLVYGAAQLLRFRADPMRPAGQDLLDVLGSARALLAEPANESPLARAAQALLDAADESQRPIYDAAQLPADSTFFDDLVPVLRRVLSVDDGKLAEDVVEALKDPHGRGLGAMAAQLVDERGYFFMRDLGSMDGLNNLPAPCTVDPDEANNGMSPCGVIGDFGSRPDRTAPDADVTLDWRGKVTADPRNNRSVFQRLLHMIADANNGRPLCSGRYAQFFLSDFPGECDMFQVDSVAQFFLLSMATPALRDRTDTFAKQAASFREAIRNGRDCRGLSSDPKAMAKCDKLLSYVTDGVSGDRALSGLLGISGFGRYPDPAPAARAIFMDLASATTSSQRTARELLFNFIANTDGSYTIDPADPDNRKFRDGSGKERLYIDEHNGVLFALEKVHAPAVLFDGSANPFPRDNFYDAMRPLVDAFAKHAECTERDMAGVCKKGQNGTQILADLLAVLHKHYPTVRSSVRGRSLADSYGAAVRAEGLGRYEPLLAQVLGGDLLLATSELAPILTGLTVDGQAGSARALPLLVKLGRFAVDPALAPPGGLTYRDGKTKTALRSDGQTAGPVTVAYLLADALKKKRAIFDKPENRAAKDRWNRAQSDVLDVLLKSRRVVEMGTTRYQWDSPRLRPLGLILLDFAAGRVRSHATDLSGWADKLVGDAQDALTGPLAAAGMDVAVKLADDSMAKAQTYALLRQVLDDKDPGARAALAVAAVDAAQLLLDEDDVVPIARGLARAVDPQTGPALVGITLLRRGRELEQASALVEPPKQVPVRLLQNLLALDPTGGPSGVHPLARLGDAIAEVNRDQPATGGEFSAADYRAVLSNTAHFLSDQQRGLTRFIQIVQSRCLPGSTQLGCPRK